MFKSSYTKHKKEISKLLCDNKITLLVLTETHTTAEITEAELPLPTYNIIICHSYSRHTGGVICYLLTSRIKI